MELSPSAHQDTFTRDHLPPGEQWPVLEFTLPELQYPDRLNAAEALIDDTAAAMGADRTALLTPDGERWSYGLLLERSNQVARVLAEDLGVVPGNRVMLRAPNNPWLVACWLGVLKAGAVVVTTMPALRAGEIGTLMELTRPTAVLCDHRFLADMRTAAGEVPVVPVGGDDDGDLTVLSAAKPASFTNVQTAADDVALLGPTSGTTGTPKITMHFHRDILANADTFARHILQPVADDVFAGSPPLAFTFGLGGLVVFPLRFGASALLTERTTPAQLAELSRKAGATVLFTAPTAYRAIIKEGLADLLRPLRMAVSAGEHLPEATWREVKKETGLELVNGIGSTEMLHVFISAAGSDIRPGATGRTVPGFRATILGPDDEEVAPGEIGRLAVIGPTGCRYLDDPRQENYVVNGWNVTGDTFRQDADGYFYYQARSDDMIVSSGYNIGAPEVEAALNQHPDVLESAVIGRPDPERGSIVLAFVVLRENVPPGDAKAVELQDFVKQVIAPYKYPRAISFVDELPRNPSGKLQHFKLREIVETAQA
ncbi:AMP-binding protein [Arthrobacter sp. zg-Y20]|uniref:AMP-binding protein n=1 Tax=unclassified Arthrobacter TaxID=235627 RepID=UPI001D13464C|nr:MULTISPECIES: AMP-binding protein [unclassified Arthrobacter]MCC3275263.1 AMP-binding protein [Arthrobacter sp. zg-Y20]MDK1315420.1 AMP-binding protein [Arthrobacter sp. zg.Y20]WIB05837.1 AMP-binding protein [Arthrobacter sp. zg-Y20]